jgi:MFS transporter, DHA2 family, multidrug resistance protein
MLSTARILGQAIGTALVALIFGLSPDHAATVALLVGAGFSALAVGVSCLRLVGGHDRSVTAGSFGRRSP